MKKFYQEHDIYESNLMKSLKKKYRNKIPLELNSKS